MRRGATGFLRWGRSEATKALCALFYVKPRLNIIPLALNSRDTKYCCEVWLTRGGNIASGIDENWEHYSSLVVHSAPGCPLITYAEVGSRAEAVRLGRPDHSAY